MGHLLRALCCLSWAQAIDNHFMIFEESIHFTPHLLVLRLEVRCFAESFNVTPVNYAPLHQSQVARLLLQFVLLVLFQVKLSSILNSFSRQGTLLETPSRTFPCPLSCTPRGFDATTLNRPVVAYFMCRSQGFSPCSFEAHFSHKSRLICAVFSYG